MINNVYNVENTGKNSMCWKIKRGCTGRGNIKNNKKPCRRLWQVEAVDICCLTTRNATENIVAYGFICPVCGCFTEVEREKIPHTIRLKALYKRKCRKVDGYEKNFC